MSTHETDHDHDVELQARLRALPGQRMPPADGWARLAAQLPPREAAPATAVPPDNVVALPQRPRHRWWLPVGAALAASLAVYAVAPWRQSPLAAPAPAPSLLQLQASAMTEEYRQAVASLPGPRAPEWQPALHELDESAAQIRAALAQDPRAPHLLGQLKRTYTLRLELTRQAAQAAAAGMTT